MSIKTTRWDSAEYLKTDEDIQLYLEACIEEAGDDPAFIVHALGVIARAKNMSQLARDTGLTREGLYKAFSPEGNPTFATVSKVAKALGLQITVQTAPREPSNHQLHATSSDKPRRVESIPPV